MANEDDSDMGSRGSLSTTLSAGSSMSLRDDPQIDSQMGFVEGNCPGILFTFFLESSSLIGYVIGKLCQDNFCLTTL